MNNAHQLFTSWFESNGGLTRKLSFPHFFSPLNYVGVVATDHIKPNEVIMAIPKKLIISVSMVRESELGKILPKYPIINESEDESSDFNILTLYVVWQKSLGTQSFFYPYFQSISECETIIGWPNNDIEKLRDPYITTQLTQQIADTFYPVYEECLKLTQNHPQLFKQKLNWKTFHQCQAIVMTRCFGWGLPQTMLVPFADFLNHSSSGIHTYSFSKKLQFQQHEHYIKKRKQLDLSLLGIDNKKQLPISYERNSRELFVHKHQGILLHKQIQYDKSIRLSPEITKNLMKEIQRQTLMDDFHGEVLASSDSQDNDSEEEKPKSVKQAFLQSHVNKLVQTQIQSKFTEPKPLAHSQFEEDVDMSWWHENDEQNYFIVSAHQHINKGQQVFNCYGKRSNKFLLIWYGFTFYQNKYDSIPFRIWDEQVHDKTGQLLFTRALTQKQWKGNIRVGQYEFPYNKLTAEYRLKKNSINYELLAFLRLKTINNSPKLKQLYKKKFITAHEVKSLQLQVTVLLQYEKIIKMLIEIYDPYTERQKFEDQSHQYFSQVLMRSNREILDAQYKSIYILNKVMEEIVKKPEKEHIRTLYNQNYLQQQENLDTKIENRKKVIDYFRMLERCPKLKR